MAGSDLLAGSSAAAAVRQRFAADVWRGLSQTPKRLPAHYFYDQRGSELFQRITELEEYYLTHSEREILQRHRRDIAQRFEGQAVRVVELGAGDGSKTDLLLESLLSLGARCQYVPIDICTEVLDNLADRMESRFRSAALVVRPCAGDYAEAVDRLDGDEPARNLLLFLGSSIGNMHPGRAERFLGRITRALNPGDSLLVGFDLKKDPEVLRRAYDDAQGVTREFNLNLLDRMNRQLEADFRREKFLHHCLYNPRQGRMESWLLSPEPQEVFVGALDRRFHFDAWEGIHVECSYKYDLRQIHRFARQSGCTVLRHFFDARRYFVDSLWRVGGS